MIDLQIAPGEVKALVNGSAIYKVAVTVTAVPRPRWSSICTDCAGAIDSLVELLQGQFSKGVMARIFQDKTGLFPAPSEIKFSCSCPDWASMCKHVAAVFYGIGARLDEQPELLFKLRKVDQKELITEAGRAMPLPKKGTSENKVLAADGLSELFGLEMAASEQPSPPHRAAEPSKTPLHRRDSKGSAPSKRKITTTKAVKLRTPMVSSPIKRVAKKGLARAANQVPVAKSAKPPTPKLSSPFKRETLKSLARTTNKVPIAKAAKLGAPKSASNILRNSSEIGSKHATKKKRLQRGAVRATREATLHARRK